MVCPQAKIMPEQDARTGLQRKVRQAKNPSRAVEGKTRPSGLLSRCLNILQDAGCPASGNQVGQFGQLFCFILEPAHPSRSKMAQVWALRRNKLGRLTPPEGPRIIAPWHARKRLAGSGIIPTGYVYQYYFYEVQKTRRGLAAGTEYVYMVSVDRQKVFPLRIFVRQGAVEKWAKNVGREMTGTEEYAVAKMRLFQAFDEVDDLAIAQPELLVDESNLEALLAHLHSSSLEASDRTRLGYASSSNSAVMRPVLGSSSTELPLRDPFKCLYFRSPKWRAW